MAAFAARSLSGCCEALTGLLWQPVICAPGVTGGQLGTVGRAWEAYGPYMVTDPPSECIWSLATPGEQLPTLLTSYFLLLGVFFFQTEFEQLALSGDSLPSLVCVITGTGGNTLSYCLEGWRVAEEWTYGIY